ncbi:DUF485 domain-containing protein [Streptomyces sp. MMBL 11-3]|uniref:DUF485 domain-containing protein n=1 Tax=Streptomyces sp. MMBL 11-3 TaxID=3382639 RepID=UPI0039B55721
MSYDTSPSYPFPPHHQPQQPYQPYQSHPPHQPQHHSHPPQPPQPPHRPRHAAAGPPGDLRELRTAYRWQRRVATLTALGYFTLFLVLSATAPSLMTGEVADGLPLGLLLGLLQVPITCAAIALYEYTARRRVDPVAERIRKQAELDTRRAEARR